MEEKGNDFIIEVRKPEEQIEENKPEIIPVDNNEIEEVNEDSFEKKETNFDDINAQIEKFQEEVSKFQEKINVQKENSVSIDDTKEVPKANEMEKTQDFIENVSSKKAQMKVEFTSDEIPSTAQGITDAIIQRLSNESQDNQDQKNIKFHFNSKNELKEINCKTIYEFTKTVADFDINKVRIFNVEEEGKTVSFLCHDGDFFAINRVNFPDGYEYTEKTKPLLSENLNSKIRKIPNVAKTRHILKIDDIETRIFDMTQYILLLSKKGQEVRILKVTGGRDISDAKFEEDNFDKKEYLDIIDDYELIEDELDREENSLKNRFAKVKEKIVNIVVNPFKMLKEKLAKTKDLKMLSEGRHSIFDKED